MSSPRAITVILEIGFFEYTSVELTQRGRMDKSDGPHTTNNSIGNE
jgi:hypothetical protein